MLVSISLSSGFSFQGETRLHLCEKFNLFPSRYRAAFHFRHILLWEYPKMSTVSISLSSGFSFQGD